MNQRTIPEPSTRRVRSFRLWVGRVALAGTLLLASSLTASYVAGSFAKASLGAKNPPPGRLVDVGGYRLHLNCQGSPVGPTVVIDAGQGDFSLSYAALQPRLAQFAHVCTYDRAGLGWSDPGPQPRTGSQAVAELRTLLQRADIPGPYVLVGQSVGGLHARLYAYTYPNEVAGLVLLDSASEEQFATNPETLETIVRFMPIYYGLAKAVVWLGLPALWPDGLPGAYIPSNMPEQIKRQYQAMYAVSTKAVSAAGSELSALKATHEELRSARGRGLGNIPIVLLTHEYCNGCGMLDGDELEFYEQNWLLQQQAVAAQSTRGRWQVAEGSGHEVHLDRPDLVIDAVREVLATPQR